MHITESLNRILSERKLLTERFYSERLFQAHPEFVHFFNSTNMGVQPLMLMMALQGVVCYLGGQYPAVEQYLRYLGTRHRKIGIPQEHLPKFCDVLVATVKDFHGDAWDAELEDEWRAALAGAMQIMTDGYREDFHV
jgi:hemoglobin-like flavoprotein